MGILIERFLDIQGLELNMTHKKYSELNSELFYFIYHGAYCSYDFLCLLSAAFAINKKAIPKTTPPTIIVVTLPIGNNSDNKNNKTPLPNSKVKPIANDIFSGNALILSNMISPSLS